MDTLFYNIEFLHHGMEMEFIGYTPIHIYHNILWDSKYQPHLYKIYQSVILLIHQIVFNKRAPKISLEAEINFLRVWNWFGEEWFT